MKAVDAHGVGRIIDLRSRWELDGAPHPFAESAGYRHIPWIDEERDAERDPAAEHTLADLYRGSLDRNTRQVACVVGAIVEATDSPVVVHCVSGKDRTGLLVALLLDLVGVAREDIARDYALSDERLGLRRRAEALRRAEAGMPVDTGPGPVSREASPRADGSAPVWSRALPESILAALDHVDSRYDGARGYLSRCGVPEASLDHLAGRLLVD